MKWPEPEGRKTIPEGHYSFRINREPDLKSFSYTDKNGTERDGRKLVIYAVGINSDGEFPVADAFLPWEPRYTELCEALGIEHSKDIEVTGIIFEADIKHQPDKKDPTKSYPRIVNITAKTDDIPF
jgi:hypothetical protein